MKINDAIERLSTFEKYYRGSILSGDLIAVALAVEALKRVRDLPGRDIGYYAGLLPGETSTD